MSITCLNAVAVVDNNLVTVALITEFNKLNRTAVSGKNKLTRSVTARNIDTGMPSASTAAVVRCYGLKT